MTMSKNSLIATGFGAYKENGVLNIGFEFSGSNEEPFMIVQVPEQGDSEVGKIGDGIYFEYEPEVPGNYGLVDDLEFDEKKNSICFIMSKQELLGSKKVSVTLLRELSKEEIILLRSFIVEVKRRKKLV